MSTYIVTVRTLVISVTYQVQGASSASVHMTALKRFGVCGVTVKPA